jgi:hypothetical protein
LKSGGWARNLDYSEPTDSKGISRHQTDQWSTTAWNVAADLGSLESSKRLVLTWINYNAELLSAETDAYNDMHVFGFGLAYMLSKYDALQIRNRQWTDLPPEFRCTDTASRSTPASSDWSFYVGYRSTMGCTYKDYG